VDLPADVPDDVLPEDTVEGMLSSYLKSQTVYTETSTLYKFILFPILFQSICLIIIIIIIVIIWRELVLRTLQNMYMHA